MKCCYGWIGALRFCSTIITIVLALAALPALAEGSDVDIAALLRSLSSDPHYNTSMMQQQEPGAIAAAQQAVWRDKLGLQLRLRNGKQLSLPDSKECGTATEVVAHNCTSFIYLGHEERAHLYQVFESDLEGGDFLVVDDLSGAMWRLSDYPATSPDGTRLAVFKNNDMGSEQGIEIWSRASGSMTLEWSGDPFGEGAKVRRYYFLVGWTSETEMKLRVVGQAEAEDSRALRCGLTALRRSTSGWEASKLHDC